MELTRDELAKMIDHTELSAHSGKKKIDNLCNEARQFGFYCVCVNPVWVSYAKEKLEGADVKVCSVIGFPLGASLTKVKCFEAHRAVEDGADEIDMVMNIGAMRDGKMDFVLNDIKEVVRASAPAHVKVILETCYLMDEQVVDACKLVMEGGAHFVKTSTGFGAFGAFPHHVRLMRETVGPDFGVKAAGGIKNFKDAWRVIEAGANRIGTSASVTILEGASLYKFAPSAWLEPEIPCHICPSRHAQLEKMPKAVYAYYKKKCMACPYLEKYNRFYE